jgi:membrane protein
MLELIQNFIDDFVWGNRLTSRGWIGRVLAQALRFLYGMVRDVFSTQLTLRAMSLVYTTLLSIVPLLAVSFSVAKGLGMVSRLRELFTQSFTQLGPDGIAIAENILQMVDRINGRAIGAIGVVIFLYTDGVSVSIWWCC